MNIFKITTQLKNGGEFNHFQLTEELQEKLFEIAITKETV